VLGQSLRTNDDGSAAPGIGFGSNSRFEFRGGVRFTGRSNITIPGERVGDEHPAMLTQASAVIVAMRLMSYRIPPDRFFKVRS